MKTGRKQGERKMNEVLKAIANRRSTRQFEPEQIGDTKLFAILEVLTQ